MNKILAIARMTVKAELRNRLLYVLLAMAFLFFFMARGCTPARINIEKGFVNPDQITRAGMVFTFNCILFWGLSLCGLLAMNALPRGVDEETITLTISNPLSGPGFFWGNSSVSSSSARQSPAVDLRISGFLLPAEERRIPGCLPAWR